MMSSFIQKLIPENIPLPGIFRVESRSANGMTCLSVRWNLDGTPGERSHNLDKERASLLDVIKSFPGVDIDKALGKSWAAKPAKMAMSNLPLPSNWVIECKPAPKSKEGFLFTFDVGILHWEKHLEVTKVHLDQLADLVGWVAEANKVDRHRA